MNSRLLRRFLETKGDRARFSIEERNLKSALHLRNFDSDELIQLGYRDPSAFAVALAFLAWRDLVANNQGNRENYVFFSALQNRIAERKHELAERIEAAAVTLPKEYS